MNRRKLLKLGAGSLGGAGLVAIGGRYALLPPSRSRQLASVDELAQRLFTGLDDETRAAACVDYEHPLRQYHNRGVGTGGLSIWRNFSREERRLWVDLLHAGLSPAGRERVPKQFFIRWPGVHLLEALICGDPTAPPYQIILSGPHLNLRIGGTNREGVAFGGPQVYGDQRGNGTSGLPGNVYRYQLERARGLFESLTSGERERATFAEEPAQTQIELQGRSGQLPGLPLAGCKADAKQRVEGLVNSILENYPERDAEYARACLEANGGIDALSLSHYERGEEGRTGPYQIFRLEGPAAVFHFRGHPHVHAFINVGMDGERPLSVGEVLGTNPEPIEGDAVKALFEDVLAESTGADVGYYEAASVAGKLREGTIRTGDVYNLESWNNVVALVEVEGTSLRAPLIRALERRGIEPHPDRSYNVATTGYVAANAFAENLGRGRTLHTGPRLRAATIGYLRQHGFKRPG